jgi:hypothetical protein
LAATRPSLLDFSVHDPRRRALPCLLSSYIFRLFLFLGDLIHLPSIFSSFSLLLLLQSFPPDFALDSSRRSIVGPSTGNPPGDRLHQHPFFCNICSFRVPSRVFRIHREGQSEGTPNILQAPLESLSRSPSCRLITPRCPTAGLRASNPGRCPWIRTTS